MKHNGISIIVLCLAAVATAGLMAQTTSEYVIGSGDVLEVSFWQDPNLDTQVRVNEDGQIAIDIIGQIEAAGKTPRQLQDDIARQISRLNKNISQAVVRVIEYNYNHVFLIGQVNNPGKHGFEVIPDLWTLINEAGGLTETADLTRVTIIRGGEDAGEIEVVNVKAALQAGTVASLPKVRRQDTIELPRTPSSVPATALSPIDERKNLIYVIGAVNTPGPIAFEDDVDVLDALAMANGPTDNADLGNAKLVLKDGAYSQTIQIDLEKYSESGIPSRYILQQENTLIVPARKAGFLGGNLPVVAGILGVVTSTLLIVDRLSDDSSP